MKTVKVKTSLSIGLVAKQKDEIELEIEEGLTPEEEEKEINSQVWDYLQQFIDFSWEIVND